ncbi:hypothetical protein [Tenacibaculum sp. 190524A05c]|uniref:hypothetical protein n=1 Tax=Tenacibaculum platacis TaxID=3137852 RepID=UPI0031FB297F
MKTLTYALIAFSVLVSCSKKKFNSTRELLDHIENPVNQYLHTKNINGVNFSLLYNPTDVMVHRELSSEVNISRALIDSLRKNYSQYLYFNISISKNGKELLSNVNSRENFGAMVQQLAFDMDKKVHMFTPQKDTIHLADYVYPRMYGMSDRTTMLFVYNKEDKLLQGEYINVTIQDLGFNTGEVKFKVPTEIIKEEVKLAFRKMNFNKNQLGVVKNTIK